MSTLSNDQIKAGVENIIEHVLKERRTAITKDEQILLHSIVALTTNLLQNVNDIAHALNNIDATYANRG